jgi:hypothetical protein
MRTFLTKTEVTYLWSKGTVCEAVVLPENSIIVEKTPNEGSSIVIGLSEFGHQIFVNEANLVQVPFEAAVK